ncbi:unnamed protein product, partial [Prorocentrum cordatum]
VAECPPLGAFLQSPGEVEREEAEMGASVEVPQHRMASAVAAGHHYHVHLRGDRTSACLTKGYGKFRSPAGYGPTVLVHEGDEAGTERREKQAAPREGADLGGELTYNDRFSRIGNSLNVRIVALLLFSLLGRGDCQATLAEDACGPGGEKGKGRVMQRLSGTG